MNTQKIEQLLGRDYSVGTEAFREDLLQQCFAVIEQENSGRVALDDDDLDMLAAAGTPSYEDPTQRENRLKDLFTPPEI